MRNALALDIRKARLEDAAEIARVYIASWQDAYPGIFPLTILQAMSLKGQTARWRSAIAERKQTVLVAESGGAIVGMASLGPTRDTGIGFDGEVYALYVDPALYGLGIGSALLQESFLALAAAGLSSCAIWAHRRGQARFFCQAMGGKLVAERTTVVMGEKLTEAAFGWRTLMLAERSKAE
jgi:GNAT superfamily N-acetyltransferase